ncbi:MAG: signal peptidase II, partial [Chloroflexota bacterium]
MCSTRSMSAPKRSGVESWPPGALTAGLAIIVLVVDQVAKAWARQTLPTHLAGAPSILDGWFSLVLTTNNGAAFGLLGGSDLLLVVVGLVLCAVMAVYAHLPSRTPLLQVSLGLQLGGAISNLTDRLR